MRRRPGRAEGLRTLVASALAALAAIPAARAQEASGYMELTAGRSDQETEDPSGTETGTEADTFLQRYAFDLSWRFYPNLRFVAGGVFDRNAAGITSDLGDSESTTFRTSPYATLLLRTALYSAQAGYYRTQDAQEAEGFTTRNTQEVYNTVLGWRPDDLPEVTLRISRTNSYDRNRLSADTTDDLAELISSYAPADELQLYYKGGVADSEDRIAETDIRRASHLGRVSYTDSWFDRRVQLAAEYDVSYRLTDVNTVGAGEVVTPIFASAGLSLITQMPTSDTLANNPALIDGNSVASAGLDLGLPPPGGDDRPRNVGLDLTTPMEVNTLLVWVDRELPQGIANSFSWDVYTSSDNVTWTLRQTVFPADNRLEIGQPPLVPSRTRFEIRFATQTSRYVKAVTSPLDNAVPNAAAFPNVFITEIQAAIAVPAREALGRTSRTVQRVTSDVRTRLLARPALYHELSYTSRDESAMPTAYTLSNGFSLLQELNPICTVSARVAREDGRDRAGDRLEYLYTGALRAVPLRTLQNSLVLSGRTTEIESDETRTNSIYLHNTAELYRGITANLSVGKSYVTAEDGARSDTTQVNALATLVPHATTIINLSHDSRTIGGDSGATSIGGGRTTRSDQAGLTYRPMPALYLFYSYRFERESRTEDRFLRSYSASWTPYPGGSLQLLLRFDETYQSELRSLSRILSPRVRWNVSSRWYLDLGYEKTTFESTLSTTRAEAFTGTMRMWF